VTTRETFLSRWARLKQETAKTPVEPHGTAPHDSAPGSASEDKDPSQTPPPAASQSEPAAAFDPASLPSLETIDAQSDISAFLARGVPAELTRAALRRVWAADPAIRDFVGLSENAWDFTAPDGVPGFGPLRATDDVGALLARMREPVSAVPTPDSESAVAAVGGEATRSKALREAETDGSRRAGGNRPQEVAHEVVKTGGEAEESPPITPAKHSEEAYNKNKDVAAQNLSNPSELPRAARKRAHGGALPD
jgi:hypothetical protein